MDERKGEVGERKQKSPVGDAQPVEKFGARYGAGAGVAEAAFERLESEGLCKCVVIGTRHGKTY